MFKIGEFSRLVRVSPRMLRHYEKCGLLYPAEIDKFTGYRQYSSGQIPLLARIVSLRDMGFSIDETLDILPHLQDAAYMDKVIHKKAASIERTIETERAKLNRLMQLSDAMKEDYANMVYDVELKNLPAVKVLSLRGIIPAYDQEDQLWTKLGEFMALSAMACPTDAEGAGYSIYHDEDYKESDVDVEIAVPVATLGASQGEFEYKELSAIPLAATVRFSGPYDGGYSTAMEKLGAWMEQNGYAFAGNLRGVAITFPGDWSNLDQLLTELQVPVAKR